MVVECQRHRDYQEAIEFFLEKAEDYGSVANDLKNQSTDAGLQIRESESNFKLAENELRTLLERFANGQSSQPIFDAVNRLYQDAREDPELRLVSFLFFSFLSSSTSLILTNFPPFS